MIGTRPRPSHQGSPSRTNHSLDHSNFPEAKRRCPRATNPIHNPDFVCLARRSKGESRGWYDSRGHCGPDCLLKSLGSVIESVQSRLEPLFLTAGASMKIARFV